MAEIVLGVASSRSPMIHVPVDLWGAIGEADSKRSFLDAAGNTVTFAELRERAGNRLAGQVRPAVWRQQHAAAIANVHRLAAAMEQAKPDVVVLFGDDENEYQAEGSRIPLLLYRGATWDMEPRAVGPQADAVGRTSAWAWGSKHATYPVATELTGHVLASLRAGGLTVEAWDAFPRPEGMQHGFGFIYERLMLQPVPVVPLMVNIHYPPNQVPPAGCYALGQAVRRAVEAWDSPARVAVAACGGLSVGMVQEELDRKVLHALQTRNTAEVAEIPLAWTQGPTGEALNWIGAAGCLEGLEMRVLDYPPAYRTAAGTGCGLAFAVWS